MELKKDIILKGTQWRLASDKLSPIFKAKPHYMLFMLALSIGIMYDRRIDKLDDSGEEIQIPRNVIVNNDNGKLDFMFQAAILSTTAELLSEEERLSLAFGEGDFDRLGFLISFANYGVTKLVGLIADTNLESMEKIKNFLIATVEGRNYDLFDLPDELLLDTDL